MDWAAFGGREARRLEDHSLVVGVSFSEHDESMTWTIAFSVFLPGAERDFIGVAVWLRSRADNDGFVDGICGVSRR